MRIVLAICAFSAFLPSIICDHKYQVKQIHARTALTDGLFFLNDQLFFVDTMAHKLCSYHVSTKKVFCATIGTGLVSFAVPVENHANKFVVGSGNDILLVTWNSQTNVNIPVSPRLVLVDADVHGNRLNYGGVDPSGRLWFGTMNNPLPGQYNPNLANVYSMDASKTIIKRIKLVGLSSGFVWDVQPNKPSKFYFDDSLTRTVLGYKYNATTGTVLDGEVVVDLGKKGINVDGLAGRLAIDHRGFLWVPLYKGSGVIEIDPHTKSKGRFISIPAARVGACTFGGPGLNTLYVSTIGYGYEIPHEVRPLNDLGGSIFAVEGLGVHGWPTIPFKFPVPVPTKPLRVHKPMNIPRTSNVRPMSVHLTSLNSKDALKKS